MDDAKLIGTAIIAIGSLISLLTPIIKISAKITSIKSSIDHMLQNDKIRDERLNSHGKELDLVVREVDKMGVTVINLEQHINIHEERLSRIEDKLSN